jgi:glycosyltransferase involved in cell wall biosynthesis
MEKLKIMILPSWYPSKSNPIAGVFFKEQAEALSQYVNVGVLNVNLIQLNKPTEILTKKRKNYYDCNGVSTFEFNYVNFIPKNKTIVTMLYKKRLIEAYQYFVDIYGKPDLIHAHVSYPAGYGAMVLSKRFNIPFIVTEHITEFETTLTLNYKKYMSETLKYADYYTAVSDPLKDKIVSAGRKQCKVIPNFVKIDKFNRELNIKKVNTNKNFDLLNVSIMTPKKGIDILLKALHKTIINNGYTQIHLHLVGEGPMKADYKELVAQLGLRDYCTFHGRINDEELVNLMNTCDTLVISSRKETFGVVGIEAFASGTPVIATRCGGPEDYVTKEVGLLVEPDNVDSLSEAIETMIEVYENYDADIIKKYFYENYSDRAVCKTIINTYKKVIKNSINV